METERNGKTIDDVTEEEVQSIMALQAKVMEQSGLSHNELTLIKLCRNYDIYRKVNVFAHRLIHF